MELPAAPLSHSPWRFSLHALLGVHSAAAALSEFIVEAPLIAGLIGACITAALVQIGVLAACTRGIRRGEAERAYSPVASIALAASIPARREC